MTMLEIQEAQSHLPDNIEQRLALRDEALRQIPRRIINNGEPLLKRQHLNREVVIGLIGQRGDGKSATGSVLSLVDYMLDGIPVWSNMAIKCHFTISDELARASTSNCLQHGGIAKFETLPLDKKALLKFDPQFKDGCFFIDEINMEFAETRRFMTNTNLYFDRVGQQLRKYGTSMIYTVIDEMWIDPRIRGLTDIFIKCRDSALTSESLDKHKPLGEMFYWDIYQMTSIPFGREYSYYVTKKPIDTIPFYFKPWRGVYDDKQVQARGMAYGVHYQKDGVTTAIDNIEIKQSETVADEKEQWLWLYEAISEIGHSGVQEMSAYDLYNLLDISPGDELEIEQHIKKKRVIPSYYHNGRDLIYQFPERSLKFLDREIYSE